MDRTDQAWRKFADGELAEAQEEAKQLLVEADQMPSDLLPDDLRHEAHTILGHVHLERGEVDEAAKELRRSADVEDTPVLSSFGPQLSLAWQLLVEGRLDDVRYFAQRFSRFWHVRSRAEYLDRS